jgi:3-oxoadipate enol-lactonase
LQSTGLCVAFQAKVGATVGFFEKASRMATIFVPGPPRLAVEGAGEGPLCLFLHGIGGNRSNWAAQLPAFAAAGFAAAAWDARGYGASEDYPGPLAFADFTDDLARVLDHVGTERAHLVGLSMGGRIAQAFALAHPNRVGALVLADTHGGFGDLTEDQRADYVRARREPLLAGKTPADIAPGVVERLVGPEASDAARAALLASVSALRADSYLKAIEATVTQDRVGDLSALACPTHFIVGEHDRLTTPEIVRRLAAQRPGSAVATIPGAGHVSNLEAPDAFNRAALGFLHKHRGFADSATFG